VVSNRDRLTRCQYSKRGEILKETVEAIDAVVGICCQAVKEVLEINARKEISFSKTIQKVPKVSMRPHIGCFVQFIGDYNGLVVMNFSGAAALTLYTSYMIAMGMPEEELAKDYTSVDVADSIGEMVNQIMGKLTKLVEDNFDLSTVCGQPKALALNSAIILTIDSDYKENRRIAFTVDKQKFYLELAMESTKFLGTP
jgi:CheY-specific phosphatase CheX